MDIYALSRSFWDYSFENPEKIKPNHIAMYFFAIEHCNRLGWKKKFGFPTSMVMDAISIKSYSVYKKTFDELAQFGFFEIIELSKNQYSSNIIALKENYNANAKALDKALTKHTSKHTSKQCQSISESTVQSTSESNDSIDIQVYNNTNIHNNIINNENIEIPISEKTIRNQYDNFLLKTSTQKEQMAMGNAMTNRQIDIACIGFVSSLLESGELKMSSIYPNFHKHFRNWFNKFGKENLGTIPKDRIELEFRTFKINEFSENNKIAI